MTTETKTADGNMTVPAGVTQLDSAKLTGPGGGGAGNVSGRTGGGGGGGAVAKGAAITVVPGETLTWVIPVGGAPGVAAVNGTAGADATLTGSVSGLLLRAKGGSGGLTGNPGVNGAGGLASGCVGPTTISGGTGGTLSTGGAGADGGGAGGTGGKPGTPGTAPGGGGGGKLGTFGGDGGAGARAELVIEYTSSVPSVTPADSAHGHAADSPTITQIHILAPADSAHGLTTESPALTNPGDPPPWGGTGRENNFDPDLNVYNFKPSNTARIRSALAEAAAGTGRAVIAVFGDSAAVPVTTTMTIDDEIGWARDAVQQIVGELGTVEAGHGVAPALWAGAASYKNEYWAFAGSYSMIANLAGLVRMNLGSSATLTPPQDCEDVEIYVTADSADFTYSVDGGAAVPVTTGAGTALEKVTISGLSATDPHTIVVNATSGVMWLAGASMVTDGPGVMLFNVAYGGSRAAHGTAVQNWTDDTSAMPSLDGARKGMADLFGLDPDLCIWMIGGNDIFQGDSVSNAITGLTEMIGWYPSADHMMTGAWEISGTNMTNWNAYWAAKYQLADDFDIILLDWRHGLAEDNATADSLGYTGNDGEHQSTLAQGVMGDNLAEILLTEFPPIPVTPDDSAHAVTTDSPALAQVHVLAPDDSALGVTGDGATLTQVHELAPADSQHIHGAESPSLTGESDLAPARAVLTHATESPALTQIHVLAPADADLGHSADSPGLVVGFTPADAFLGHSADGPDLTQTHNLQPDDATHQHVTDSPPLAQVHELTPDDSQIGHTSEQPALTQAHDLDPGSSEHGHGASSPTLGQVHELAPAPAQLEHATESPTLTQIHQLAPVDSEHQHAAEQPSLTSEGTIAPNNARITHGTESPELTQVHILQPASSSHQHTAEQPTLGQTVDLAPDSTTHAHETDPTALTQVHVLAPDRSVTDHGTESSTLTQVHILQPADSANIHTADLAAITQVHVLAALDAVLHHDTSSPTIVVLGATTPRERTLVVPKDVREWTVPQDPREWRVLRDRRTGSAP